MVVPQAYPSANHPIIVETIIEPQYQGIPTLDNSAVKQNHRQLKQKTSALDHLIVDLSTASGDFKPQQYSTKTVYTITITTQKGLHLSHQERK